MKPLKTLGLAALAITVVVAFVGVSPATAAQFRSSTSPVMLFGQGNLVFSIDGQAAICTKVEFEKASLSTPANTVPGTTAKFSNSCTVFGFSGGTINMGTCTFELLTPNSGLEGNLAIKCNGGTPITIQSSAFFSECKVTIGEGSNTNLSKISYGNNNPAAGKVLANVAITGITAVKNLDNGLCPLSGTGTVNNATSNGLIPFEATGATFFVS